MNTSKKPNIVVILSDQQRWDTIGTYGQELPLTPNIDRMAEEGTCFEQAYTSAPVCGPARACLMTGRYPSDTGCYRNGIGLKLNENTLPRYLKKHGYDVAYVGKWHLGNFSGGPHKSYVVPDGRGGFDDFWIAAEVPEFCSHSTSGWLYDKNMEKVEFNKYRVDAYTDFALQYLDQRPEDKPFFLFLSYIEPHQQSYRQTHYNGPRTKKQENTPGLLMGFMRYEGPEEEIESMENAKVPCDLLENRGHWDVAYPDYLASCKRIDDNLERVLERLEELNIADNTLVIYASDHASHFHSRISSDKATAHENSCHVPLVIKGPGFNSGKRIKQMVNLLDLPPTILRSADAPVPDDMRGQPLQKLIAGDDANWNNEILVQTPSYDRGLRTLEWSYIISAPQECQNGHGGSKKYRESALYDLKRDPGEQNNIVALPEYDAIRNELRERLIANMVKAGEDEPEIERIGKNYTKST